MGYRLHTSVYVTTLIAIALGVVWLASSDEQDERSLPGVTKEETGIVSHVVTETSPPSSEPAVDHFGILRTRFERGSGVNPTIDRFGIPSSEVVELSREEQKSMASKRKHQDPPDSGVSGNRAATRTSKSDFGELEIDPLVEQGDDRTPFDSNIFSNEPEETDQGIMGLAPEDISNSNAQLPPMTTAPSPVYLGPGFFDADNVDLAPEDSQRTPVVD